MGNDFDSIFNEILTLMSLTKLSKHQNNVQLQDLSLNLFLDENSKHGTLVCGIYLSVIIIFSCLKNDIV